MNKQNSPIREYFLEKIGVEDIKIKKEDARILWNIFGGENDKDGIDKDGISDLVVIEFKKNKVDGLPLHLYEKYLFDIGNCLSDWNEYTLAYLMYRFFLDYRVEGKVITGKILKELVKINEFRYEVTSMLISKYANVWDNLDFYDKKNIRDGKK